MTDVVRAFNLKSKSENQQEQNVSYTTSSEKGTFWITSLGWSKTSLLTPSPHRFYLTFHCFNYFDLANHISSITCETVVMKPKYFRRHENNAVVNEGDAEPQEQHREVRPTVVFAEEVFDMAASFLQEHNEWIWFFITIFFLYI